jgi:microcystin-dependent protein
LNNDNVQGANIAENCAPSGINNAIRGLASIVKRAIGSQGTAIASAATTAIGAPGTALYTTITGTTTITSFGTVSAGTLRIIEFGGALTLTQNATSLILPGGANITTAASDIALMISKGSGNWKCLSYIRASGLPVLADTIVPSGAVMPYAGTSTPGGWQLCYGQAISRTTYAALFAVIGTTYGAGDGSTTFNVPDLRGRVVAGQDDMGGASANRLTGQSGGVNGDTLGATGGAETHTLTIAQIPAHTHDVTAYAATAGSTGGIQRTSVGVSPQQFEAASVGGGAAHNNVPPTIILNYIIKE